jgi:hypothetical protein
MIMRIVPTRRFSPAFIATFSSLENFSRIASASDLTAAMGRFIEMQGANLE